MADKETNEKTGAEEEHREGKVADYLQQHYPLELDDILLADGFDDAFMGVAESFGTKPKACYDIAQCLAILRIRDKMSSEEATEYMKANVTGAYIGERTPAFMIPITMEFN